MLSQALGFWSVIGGALGYVGMKRSLATAMTLKWHRASITVNILEGFFPLLLKSKKKKKTGHYASFRMQRMNSLKSEP